MREPTWAVVATVDEPAPLIISFAAHYLALGAAEVHLFLDRPNPVAEAALAGLPRLHLTVCDAAYWAQVRARPLLHVRRQRHNANKTYKKTQVDFLLHCDCDEFVRDGAGMVDELASLPAEASFLRLQVAERVQRLHHPEGQIFEGMFRWPIDAFFLVGEEIYGKAARFFRDGLTGHRAGKAVVRTGLDLTLGLHAPEGWPTYVDSAPGRLLHFDGLTRLHYALKLLRRAYEPERAGPPRHGRPRLTQIRAARDWGKDGVWRMVEQLKTVTPKQISQLEDIGHLDLLGFDPSPALARFGLAPDLSAAAFDAELRARDAAFIATCGPSVQED